MENKQMIFNGVFIAWLALLSYQVFFSSSIDDNTLARTQAIGNVPSPISAQTAIKPSNSNTQPVKPQPVLKPEDAAKIEFKAQNFDFGTIQEGDEVQHIFKFTNTSDNPLIIKNAKGSCGCTVPEWPREPVAPGKQGEIKVKFNSKGKKGNQNTTVTLQANTIPGNTVLTIKSNVIALEANK